MLRRVILSGPGRLFSVLVGVMIVAIVLGSSAAQASSDGSDFEPVFESSMPEGFPPYTPVGEIEVKHYPGYRKAESAGRVAFWTLFRHISNANISMTAPVEMTYQEEGPPVGREQAMAFLYGDPSLGEPGRQGNVDVSDVPPMTVVSIGVRGARTNAAVSAAHTRLLDWLGEHAERYEQHGPVRVMGYNSPFVPRDRQFFEVQIPIRERAGAAADA